MTTDLTNQLRAVFADFPICTEAADLIEHLQAQNAMIRASRSEKIEQQAKTIKTFNNVLMIASQSNANLSERFKVLRDALERIASDDVDDDNRRWMAQDILEKMK